MIACALHLCVHYCYVGNWIFLKNILRPSSKIIDEIYCFCMWFIYVDRYKEYNLLYEFSQKPYYHLSLLNGIKESVILFPRKM